MTTQIDTSYRVGPTLEPGERPWPLHWETDADVMLCPHDEWESVLVVGAGRRFDEVIRCVACHAPRCGNRSDAPPCLARRHHGGDHVLRKA